MEGSPPAPDEWIIIIWTTPVSVAFVLFTHNPLDNATVIRNCTYKHGGSDDQDGLNPIKTQN